MNSTEILEGNQLIANFIKSKQIITGWMQYHVNWNQLMNIVENIELLKHPVYIHANNCIIYETVGKNHGWFIDNYSDTKIKATWLSCVEFIKYYNKQKQQ